jgi:hypothetical protein
MADFNNKHRNLEVVPIRFDQHQRDFFEVLKLRGRTISQFVRLAVDRAIDQEKNK